MKIARDTVVAIEYTIRDSDGSVVDTSEGRQPLLYLHGYRQIVPGVESAIEGHEAGHSLKVNVEPSDGYGDRDPEAILVLPRAAFPDGEDLAPGAMFRAFRPDGRPLIFSVLESTADVVVVDANHPLAGQTLLVDVEILSVRRANDDEKRHRHVHPDSIGQELAPSELA